MSCGHLGFQRSAADEARVARRGNGILFSLEMEAVAVGLTVSQFIYSREGPYSESQGYEMKLTAIALAIDWIQIASLAAYVPDWPLSLRTYSPPAWCRPINCQS